MTNIDHIRRMSLVELAQFLCTQGWRLGEEGECQKWLEDEATELTPSSSQPLSIEAIETLREKEEMVWIQTTGYVNNKSGWGIAGKRAYVTQDFFTSPLWYSSYGIDWIAFARPPENRKRESG